ncbi:MAG: hypothetical protein JW889_10660 [Verrucomicrobia bacterium]|nr:hypothetical protein [Verrucomicrobiota bacterium]
MSSRRFQNALSGAARSFARLDDRFNPIAVKELRRSFQTQTLPGILLLLLVGALVVMGVSVLGRDASDFSADAGRQAFLILYGSLVVTSVLLLPIQVASRMALDRARQAEDLFRMTAMRARSVVWGLLSSGLALVVFIHSACAPFLVFACLLRGIDLSSVLFLLLLALLASAVVMQMFIFFACLRVPRNVSALFGLFAVGWAFQAIVGLIALASGMTEGGLDGVRPGSEFLMLAVTLVLSSLLVAGLFFVLSVALVSPRAANRALPVRLYISAMWVLTFAAVVVESLRRHDLNAVVIWVFANVCLLTIAMWVAVGERDTYGPRVLRQIPRSGLARLVAFPFFSGAANGVTWTLIMMGMTIAAGSLCVHVGRIWYGPDPSSILLFVDYLTISKGLALQATAYALTALLIRQRFWPKARESFTWTVLAVIIAVVFVLPVIGALTTSEYGSGGETWLGMWYVLTPVGLTEHYVTTRVLTIRCATFWGGLMLFYNVFWLVERMRAFGRHGRRERRAHFQAAHEAAAVADPPDASPA